MRFDRTPPTLTNIRVSSNNTMTDSAGIGDIDSLFFTISEPQRTVSVLIEELNIVPEQNGLEFVAIRELNDEGEDGFINFSIVVEDSAGNSTGEVIETSDGSYVWFDGTRPTLSYVTFNSTNANDSSLAIIGDTLILDFQSSEPLGSLSVFIAETEADTIYIDDTRSIYRSWYVLDGSEEEGYIPFQITLSDLVGNSGEDYSSTTDQSSILFDITPPDNFQLDSAYAVGGNEIFGYWNASNNSIVLETPISITDESLVGGSFQPLISIGGGEFENFGSPIEIVEVPETGSVFLEIAGNIFESMSNYADNINAIFTTKIIDKAGNETQGLSDGTIIHVDEIIPTLDSIGISTNNALSNNWATTSDNIVLEWISNEGLNNVISIIINDTTIVNADESGKVHSTQRAVNLNDTEGPVTFSLFFSDSAGNQGTNITETSDGSTVGIDISNPSINSLMEGFDNLDPKYYNNSDTITLYWSQDDAISGIRETYYGLGTQPNATDLMSWTLGETNNFGGWNNLELENENQYFGAAFVRDSAGNYSDTIWGDGIYIDTEIPIPGTINDGQWILEMDYTPDSTFLEYQWEGFSDNIGIDHFELSIGTNNDTVNIQNWYPTDSVANVKIEGLNLDRDTLYFTYIKAVDSASNYSSIVKTDGIYFDDSEPKVMKVTPDFNDSLKVLSIMRSDTIIIKFNRLIYFYDLRIESGADSNLITQESYSDSTITITWDDTLLSNDTITVYLDSALAYNSLFISDTLKFFSYFWGDLNYDHDLTVEDILQFNRSWPEVDLGPFIGKPPHIKPNLDGDANLTDLTSFAKMWQWRYFNLSFDTLDVAYRIQDQLSLTGRGSNVKIPLPQKTSMAELLIGYSNFDIQKMDVIKSKRNTFLFKSIDTLNQLVQFSLADYKGLDSILTLVVPDNRSNKFSAQIQYRFMDSSGNILSSGTENVNLDLLPEKFLVHDNYPNPFNPITTIQYELPNYSNVKVTLFDITGRTIKEINFGEMVPGRYAYVWDGTNDVGNLVSTGIYFFQINAGSNTAIKKMLLLK